MSVKLADTLKPMADFPVAEATDVSIEINGTDKDLQQAYEDGDLGGGGSSIQVDSMPLASAEVLGKIFEYTGPSGTYQHGFFYECVSDGETPATYSWEQRNTQPHSKAGQIDYDGTDSGLSATKVQGAIDEIVDGLGDVSGKNVTTYISPNNPDVPTSGTVYTAMTAMSEGIYHPSGEKTCAELTADLLVQANVGHVYIVSDSGLTTDLFVGGAGKTISEGDNVIVVYKYGTNNEFLFDKRSGLVNLSDYQKKDLDTPLTIGGVQKTTVEGALGGLNGVIPSDASTSNKLLAQSSIANGGTKVLALKGYSTADAVDLNTLKRTGVYSVTSQLASNLPDSSFLAWWQIIVINKSTTNTGYCSQIAMARNNAIYMRDCENDVWSSWQKLITESDFNYKSGTVNFSCGANDWTTVNVTFDSPMPDTDYVVTLESGNTAYVHVQNVTTKSTNGFIIILWNRDSLSDGRGIINWQAYKIPH